MRLVILLYTGDNGQCVVSHEEASSCAVEWLYLSGHQHSACVHVLVLTQPQETEKDIATHSCDMPQVPAACFTRLC